MMYVLPKEHSDRLFTLNDGFNKEHEDYFAFHGEVAFLIRRPALEIMNLLEKTDFNKPVNRYVLCESISIFSISISHLMRICFK